MAGNTDEKSRNFDRASGLQRITPIAVPGSKQIGIRRCELAVENVIQFL